MIYHIVGPPGSGKTTLLNNFKNNKKIIAIDTDDIFDEVGMELLSKKYKNIKKTQVRAFWKDHNKLREERIFDIIDDADAKNKDLIIAGVTLMGKADPINYADYKYFIDIDFEENFRRILRRQFDDECQQKEKIIKDIYASENDIYNDLLMMFKYKLRMGSGPTSIGFAAEVKNNRNVIYKRYKSYPKFSPGQIYKNIWDSIQQK